MWPPNCPFFFSDICFAKAICPSKPFATKRAWKRRLLLRQFVMKMMVFALYLGSDGLQNHLVWLVNIITRWWFQIFYIFTATWGNDPIWLIFFKWVETTNQIIWGWTHPAFTFVQVWGDVLAAVLKRIVGRKSAQDALSQTLGHFDCKHRFFSGFLHVFFFVVKSLSKFSICEPNARNVHTFCKWRLSAFPPATFEAHGGGVLISSTQQLPYGAGRKTATGRYSLPWMPLDSPMIRFFQSLLEVS